MDYSTPQDFVPPHCDLSDWQLFSQKIVVDPMGCWVWEGPRQPEGYGNFCIRQVKWKSHRFAYVAAFGAIPQGLHIDHLCRNRLCSNPAHLETVTQRENTLRGIGTSAINSRKTHCLNGHEFNKENTSITRKGQRRCRVCHTENEAVARWLPRVRTLDLEKFSVSVIYWFKDRGNKRNASSPTSSHLRSLTKPSNTLCGRLIPTDRVISSHTTSPTCRDCQAKLNTMIWVVEKTERDGEEATDGRPVLPLAVRERGE